MNKQSGKKFRSFVLGILWLAAVCAELYFLLYDVPILESPSGQILPTGEKIATLESRKNDVRVQAPGDLVWQSAQKGETLYQQQTIQTLSQAQAEIAFLDGSGLMLDETSLIVLERTSDSKKIVINLLRGKVRKKPGVATKAPQPTIEIRAGETTVELSLESDLSVDWSPRTDKKPAIEVHGGEVTVTNAEGSKLMRSEPMVPPEDEPPPPPDLMEPEIEISKPRPRRSYLFRVWDWIMPSALAEEQEWGIKLRWAAVPGAQRYKVQVGRDQAFSRVISEAEVFDPEWEWAYRLGMENSKGRAFFRVASVSSTGKVGGFSKPKPITIPQEILALRNVPKVVPAPVVPAPAPKLVAAAPAKPSPPLPWAVLAGVYTGLGNFSQTSREEGFRSVSMEAPYPFQKFSLGVGISKWVLQAEAAFARYEQFGLPATQMVTGRAELFRRFGGLGLGVGTGRAFRWSKTTAKTVSAEAAFGAGPMVTWGHHFGVFETGFLLSAPISGFSTESYFGAEAAAWTTWRLGFDWLGLQLEGNLNYSQWKVPVGTRVISWAVWVAPVFRWRAHGGG